MFINAPASSSTASLSLEDLGWLAASALIDLPTLPSPRSSFVYAESSPCRDFQLTAQSSTSSFQSALEEQGTTQLKHTSAAETISPTPVTSPPSPDFSSSDSLTSVAPVKPRRFSPSTPHLPSPPLTPPHHVSPFSPIPGSPARQEWIYRQPRTPPHSRSQRASPTCSPTRSRPRPQTGYHSPPALTRKASNSSIRSTGTTPSSKRADRIRHTGSNTVPPPFWSTILRPRSRSERSIPLLKSIPSQSQIDFTPAPSTLISAGLSSSTTSSLPSASDPFKANSTEIRPPSVASSLSSASLSTATSSSRPETPTSPTIIPSSYNSAVRPRYQRRRATDPTYGAPLSSSCPPSKSILTRASSISTKNSTSTAASKSVKFVDMPTVHYAGTGYWNLHTSSNAYLERAEAGLNMGLDVDSMDVDVDSQLSASLDRSYPDECSNDHPELRCSTPTPEKERAKGLRRLVTITKKSSPYSRPTISGPYALGMLPSSPPPSASRSTVSLKSQSSKHSTSTKSADTGVPLRAAPSLESFRSVKSTGGKSVRSLGSVKSNASTRGFRAWLSRIVSGI